MHKKAEMGVGTLIVFIAMLLVAAVAAGVLIQTVTSLQEKALSTGGQAKSQISTNAQVIEVSATDGRNGNLTDFQQLIKLSPGSDPIKLDQIIFTVNTKDTTSTLRYRGTSSICEKNNVNGYNTWTIEHLGEVNTSSNFTLEEDLDDDGADDTVYISDAENLTLTFVLSTAGNYSVTIPGNINLTDVPASGTTFTSSATGTVRNGTGGTTYATIALVGTATENNSLDSGIVRVTPYRNGEGYFSAVYEQQGTNWVNGNLQRGDIIRLCYESGGEIEEDSLIRLNFIPKIGTSTLTEFVTPDVISTERVYLYP